MNFALTVIGLASAIVAAAPLWAEVAADSISAANFARIKPGMTRAEAEKILDGPGDDGQGEGRSYPVRCQGRPPHSRFGEMTSDPLTMYLSEIYTISANRAGFPGIIIPCGFTRAGLQILEAPRAEEKLLRVARMHERETDWHKRRPVL